MGCRTGFYLLLAGDYESKDIIPLMVVFNPEKSLPHLRENRKADDAQILKKMNELEPMVDDNHKKVL